MSERPTANLYPRVTSFRSRRGALTAAQQRSWDATWPSRGRDAWGAAGPDSGPADYLDTDAWFGRTAPLILEIGCGTGTSTAAMALAEPELDVIAVEVYRPGLAQLLMAIERENITNVRVIRGDAVDVTDHMIKPGSLTGIRVFFPDPWPKARHHKRRLLQAEMFAKLASLLQVGGVLHVATDHADYAEHIAETGDAEPQLHRLTFESLAQIDSPISHERPVTKFEGKAEVAGNTVTEFIWGRIEA